MYKNDKIILHGKVVIETLTKIGYQALDIHTSSFIETSTSRSKVKNLIQLFKFFMSK